MKTNTQSTEADILQRRAESLGLSLEVGPCKAEIRDGDWTCVSFPVTLKHNGATVHSSRYSMGVGHVPALKEFDSVRTGGRNSAVFWTLIRKGYSVIPRMSDASDRDEALEMLKRKAVMHKVTPSLSDVLHSFLLDGSPDFDAESFEDWANNFGYDSDSRKAEKMYRECVATGQALRRVLSSDELETLRELANEL